MALKGISKFEELTFISPRDPAQTEGEGATVFVYGMFDVDTRARIADRTLVMQQATDGATNMFVNAGSRNLEAVRYGLRGWRNYRDDSGNDIKFETIERFVNGKTYRVPSDAAIAAMDPQDLEEVAEAILRANKLIKEQVKN